MLMGLNRKAHSLFVHVTAKTEITSSLKKMKSKIPGWYAIHWLVVCPTARLSALFASVWSCKICILYGNRWRSWCIMRMTELLERSVSWDRRPPWRHLQTLSHRYDVIFFPDWRWPATATVNAILYTSRLPEFVEKALYSNGGSWLWFVGVLQFLTTKIL